MICALTSLIAAIVAGILTYTARPSRPEAVLYAGGAFAVAITLGLSTLTALGLV